MPKITAVTMVTSGDLRQSANQVCWPQQEELERNLTQCFREEGVKVTRAFPVDPSKGHGFISSQRMGMDIFSQIDPEANLVFATAAWQYSHHVLPGMRHHRGPILTVANWSGRWPGLVGLLNLNGSLIKAGVRFSTLWSERFDDEYFLGGLREWIHQGTVSHDASHVRPLEPGKIPHAARRLGDTLAAELKHRKAILGVFDEGCMGMYNAIIDDELLNPLGVYKERLSQSALWAEMQRVSDAEAAAVGKWLAAKGMTFRLGSDEGAELTAAQLHWQYKMYVAALRIADDFGLDAVGIQYQQGLKDLVPASDLVEGLLNNVDRPPVTSRDGRRILFEGLALPNFNEVDEGVAVDALITNRVWRAMGLDPATTLHDVRWGEDFGGRFVWVFEISGSVPPSHFESGYAGAVGWRQNPMYFPAGGATIKGVAKPGPIVWSRLYI